MFWEANDWSLRLAALCRSGARVISLAARTFTDLASSVVERRLPGQRAPSPVWIVNRCALEAALAEAGWCIMEEVVWFEPIRIRGVTEVADSRTLLLRAPEALRNPF